MTCNKNLIPFEIEHLEQINMRPMDHDMFNMFGGDPEVFKICEKGYGATYTRDGKIIACGGVYPLWEGVGQCWMIASNNYKEHGLNVGRYMRLAIDTAQKQFGFKRVQGTTRADHGDAIDFLEWAGFKREGLLKNYGYNGKDHIMYARIAEEEGVDNVV